MADTLNVYRDGGSNLTPPTAGGGGKLVLTIVGLCLLLGGIAWFLLSREDHAPVAAAPPDAGVPAAPPKPTLPSPSESDPRVRSLLGSASTDPKWSEYLKQSDLVRVFVSATNNVAEGESPRTRLFFLAPEGKFETTDKTDRRKKTKKTFIAPASYARYDGIAAVVGSLDEAAIANAYLQLKPWIDLAYEEIGPRNAKFDTVWQGAVTRLVNAPVPAGDVEVVAKGLVFAFADPALEGLSAAEKHLLRMGAKNQKVIQTKLQAISDAIAAGSSRTMDADGGMVMGTSGDGGATMGGAVTSDGGMSALPSGTGTGTTGMTTGATDTSATMGTTGTTGAADTTGTMGTTGTATDAGAL